MQLGRGWGAPPRGWPAAGVAECTSAHVQGPAQKVTRPGDTGSSQPPRQGRFLGSSTAALPLLFSGPAGRGAELREAGTPASRPALRVLPPALPEAATPRLARRARSGQLPLQPPPQGP